MKVKLTIILINVSRVQQIDAPDDSDDPEEVQKARENNYLYEVTLVGEVHDIGHGPKLLDYVSQHQGPRQPCPDGLVDFIIMSCVPGRVLMDIHRGLSRDQIESVRMQIVDILE